MLSVGQEVQAIEAIDKAVELAPSNTANRITLAQALMTTGDVNNLERAQRLLQGLLAENPQNDNLALMMAVVSAQLGDLDNTKRFFAQVRNKLPADSDMSKRLSARIIELEQRSMVAVQSEELNGELKNETSIFETSVETSNEDITGFSVTVDLSLQAKESAPSTGFLIVFAQDLNSDNRMPAAVVKLPIPAFPATISLTTENAMMPQYTLASLSDVVITARLSLDGNVAVAQGEWQGSVESPVKPSQLSSVNITINKEL
jgi:thioredoxin-like negative regulator of GroEL